MSIEGIVQKTIYRTGRLRSRGLLRKIEIILKPLVLICKWIPAYKPKKIYINHQ